jgi:CMP-N,N'-diacetyllegionaminic acid synthase
MRVLGLIPARGGSKGVPKKNGKMLGDKPLVAHTIVSASQSALLDTIVVSTDSDEIFEIAARFGCEPPFKRPDNLAQDKSTSWEVVLHALDFFGQKDMVFDAVCLLQPTTPFREHGFIDRAIEIFKKSEADSLISVLPVPHEYNPHWVFEPSVDDHLKIATGENTPIPRRQDLPKAFHRDGSVYIVKSGNVKSGNPYGSSIAYIESDPAWHVNIDTPRDWEKAERLWAAKR